MPSKGQHLTPEQRAHYSEAQKKRWANMSPEERSKRTAHLKRFEKGHIPWMKKLPKDSLRYKQFVETARKNLPKNSWGIRNGFYGKRHTEERRKKLSEFQKKLWRDPAYRRKMLPIIAKAAEGNRGTVRTPKEREKIKEGILSHRTAVLEEMKGFTEQGYRCVPVHNQGFPCPDFVAIKDDRVFGVEVETKDGEVDSNKYADFPYYDDIVWIVRKQKVRKNGTKT